MQTKIYVITKYSEWKQSCSNELICTNPKKVIEYINNQDIDINYYCIVYNENGETIESGCLFKTKESGKIDLT